MFVTTDLIAKMISLIMKWMIRSSFGFKDKSVTIKRDMTFFTRLTKDLLLLTRKWQDL